MNSPSLAFLWTSTRTSCTLHWWGGLAIFHLAPQDYHRFHLPMEGRIGEMTYIYCWWILYGWSHWNGIMDIWSYYPLELQAIRTALDIYGENIRKNCAHWQPAIWVCDGGMHRPNDGWYPSRRWCRRVSMCSVGKSFGYFAFGMLSLFPCRTLSNHQFLWHRWFDYRPVVREGEGGMG